MKYVRLGVRSMIVWKITSRGSKPETRNSQRCTFQFLLPSRNPRLRKPAVRFLLRILFNEPAYLPPSYIVSPPW